MYPGHKAPFWWKASARSKEGSEHLASSVFHFSMGMVSGSRHFVFEDEGAEIRKCLHQLCRGVAAFDGAQRADTRLEPLCGGKETVQTPQPDGISPLYSPFCSSSKYCSAALEKT